jgi:hypothetical protein
LPEKTIISARPVTAVSATISSLASVLLHEVIEKKFPVGYFKTMNIVTSSRSTQMEGQEVPKYGLPSISATPKWDSQDDPYLDPSGQLYWASSHIVKPLRGNNPVALDDREGGRLIVFTRRRMRIDFEFRCRVQGVMQAMDLVHYLKSVMEPGGYFYHYNAVMEAVVPNHFISYMMSEMRVKRGDQDSLDEFRKYVKDHSLNMLDKKRRLADGRDIWMLSYKCNILLGLTDKPSFAANKKDGVDDDQEITFTLSSEIWMPSGWVMELEGDGDDDGGEADLPEGVDIDQDGSEFVVSYSIHNARPPQVAADGRIMIDVIGFVSDDTPAAVETLDINGLLGLEVTTVIRRNLHAGRDNSGYFTLALYRAGGIPLSSPSGFEIDWESLVVKVRNPFAGMAHSLVLYADLDKVNAVVAEGPLDLGEFSSIDRSTGHHP